MAHKPAREPNSQATGARDTRSTPGRRGKPPPMGSKAKAVLRNVERKHKARMK